MLRIKHAVAGRLHVQRPPAFLGRGFAGLPINAQPQLHIRPLLPLGEFALVHMVAPRLRAVHDGDIAIICPVIETVLDDAPHRRQRNPARNEQQILPLPRLDRKTIAVRPAKAHQVTNIQPPQRPRHSPRLPERAFDVTLARRTARDTKCGLAFAERIVKSKLPNAKIKRRRFLRVQKL